MNTQTRVSLCSALVAVSVVATSLIIERSAMASDETTATTLYPGWNLIGWIHEDRPTSELFQELPQLEAIHAYDGNSAHRNRPANEQALIALKFGSGYWFLVDSPRPFTWLRHGAPSGHSLQLKEGPSAVAWTGGDNMPVGDALIGLRPRLNVAWRWIPAEQRFLPWAPIVRSPYRDGVPVNRGDAFLLDMKSSMSWLHPSGRLPEIVFPGGLDHSYLPPNFRRIVEDDLRHAIAISTGYGELELDPSTYRVVIPTTDAERFKLIGKDESEGLARSEFSPPEHAFTTIVVAWHAWDEVAISDGEPKDTRGRRVLLHEFFHAMQFALAGTGLANAPAWLVEGTTNWISVEPLGFESVLPAQLGSEILHLDRHEFSSYHDIRVHALGAIAMDLLMETSDRDAMLDFWKVLGPAEPMIETWQDAFESAFGLSVPEFYEHFYQRRSSLFTQITGLVIAPDDRPLEQLRIVATVSHDPDRISPPERHARVAPDGSYTLNLPRGERHALAIEDREFGCRLPIDRIGRAQWTDQHYAIASDAAMASGPTVIIPSAFCKTSVRIRFTGSAPTDVDPQSLRVSLCTEDGANCVPTKRTGVDLFETLAPTAGTYVAAVRNVAQNCPAYIAGNRMAPNVEEGDRVYVDQDDAAVRAHWNSLQDLCDLTLRFTFVGPSRDWLQKATMTLYEVFNEDGVAFGREARVTPDGLAVVEAPEVGRFRLGISVPHPTRGIRGSCHIRSEFEEQWLSRSPFISIDAGYFDVARDTPRSFTWEIHPDACRWLIEGRVTDPRGTPFANLSFDLGFGVDGDGSGLAVTTDQHGSFSELAPIGGPYTMIYPYWRQNACEAAADPSLRHYVRVDSDDLLDIRWVLPTDPCNP